MFVIRQQKLAALAKLVKTCGKENPETLNTLEWILC